MAFIYIFITAVSTSSEADPRDVSCLAPERPRIVTGLPELPGPSSLFRCPDARYNGAEVVWSNPGRVWPKSQDTQRWWCAG